MHHLAKIKRLRGKALIEENGYSGEYAPAISNKLHPCSVLVKLSNAACMHFQLALWEFRSKLKTSQN